MSLTDVTVSCPVIKSCAIVARMFRVHSWRTHTTLVYTIKTSEIETVVKRETDGVRVDGRFNARFMELNVVLAKCGFTIAT